MALTRKDSANQAIPGGLNQSTRINSVEVYPGRSWVRSNLTDLGADPTHGQWLRSAARR
jgi:hypothetical protein